MEHEKWNMKELRRSVISVGKEGIANDLPSPGKAIQRNRKRWHGEGEGGGASNRVFNVKCLVNTSLNPYS
jgi:hypothetical protein